MIEPYYQDEYIDNNVKDLRIELKIKNNLLYERLIKYFGLKPLTAISKEIGVSLVTLLNYLSFKTSPITSGKAYRGAKINDGFWWKKSAERIAQNLDCSCLDIFPENTWEPKENNKYSFAINWEDAENLLSFSDYETLLLLDEESNPFNKLIAKENSDNLYSLFTTLTPREVKVLKLRFGFDGPVCTLEECSKILSVTRERIRQIEAKALGKLRHPLRRKLLEPYEETGSREDNHERGR